MKTSFKKNQLIITALAVMIAIAGYLKYSDGMIDSGKVAATSTTGEAVIGEEALEMDISEEEIYASTGITEELATEIAEYETVSDEQPGEAVLTSSDTAGYTFSAEVKLNRDQTRTKNIDSLLEIINSEVVSEAQKQGAIEQMMELTDISEKETGAETLLLAKGFEDVVVSISDSKVDVVIAQSEISDAQRAQIEDIITRKTGVLPENIVITPMAAAE